MAAYRRGKKSSRPLRKRYRRRASRRVTKPVKRYVRSVVRNHSEPKRISLTYVDQPVAIGYHKEYSDSLSDRIKQGFDKSERVGRQVHLTGIKFKRSIVNTRANEPLHVKWFIGQWKGSPDVTSSGPLANMRPWAFNGEPYNASSLGGPRRSFATINTREWSVIMAGAQQFDHSVARGWDADGRSHKMRSSFKKCSKTLLYSKTPRQVDSTTGMDYFENVDSDRPIYLFVMASNPRCDTADIVDVPDAVKLHYQVTLYFRDP